MLDGVFNHVSRNHPAVQAALDETAGRLNPADNPWHGLVRAHVGDNGEPALDVFEGHGIWWRWTIRLTRPLTMWSM